MFGHSQKVIIGRCHKCTRTEVDTTSYGPEDEVKSGIGRGRILHELSVLYIAKNFGCHGIAYVRCFIVRTSIEMYKVKCISFQQKSGNGSHELWH